MSVQDLVVTLGERGLVEHLETFSAVSRGAVVSHSPEVIRLLGCVHHPAVKKHRDVLHVLHHSPVGQT